MEKSNELSSIIVGCKKGDNESFGKLIELYSDRCYGYFYRLSANRDVTEELLSKLFVKLVEKIASFKGGNFDVWLFKTASNIFYDYLRKKQRRQKLLIKCKEQLETQGKEKPKSDEAVIDNLQTQLNKLDIETRELILLRYYSQVGFREIAQARGEALGTTLSKIHRGLKELRDLMEQHNNEQ